MMDEHTKQLLLLGREHYQKREFDKAEPDAAAGPRDRRRLADVHDMLGVICHSRGNFAQAEYHFERALAINPSYTEAALNLAVTYNDRGKYEAARQVYARIKGDAGRERRTGSIRSRAARSPTCTPRWAGLRGRRARARGHPRVREGRLACARSSRISARSSARCCARSTICRAPASSTRPPWRARPSYVPARIQLGVTLLSLGDSDAAASSGEQGPRDRAGERARQDVPAHDRRGARFGSMPRRSSFPGHSGSAVSGQAPGRRPGGAG
jgi:tetratricopeptide (TPR) repeat protein